MMFLPMIMIIAAFIIWTFLYADIQKDERMEQYYREVADLPEVCYDTVVYRGVFNLEQFDYDRKIG